MILFIICEKYILSSTANLEISGQYSNWTYVLNAVTVRSNSWTDPQGIWYIGYLEQRLELSYVKWKYYA